MSKSAPASVSSGAQLTYTITYGNTGGAAASSVVIKETLPAGTTFVSATGGGIQSGGVVTWNVGAVGAGVTGQTVSFTVSVTATSGDIVNGNYTIEGTGISPIFGPPVTTTVQSTPAALTILKTASTPAPILGTPATPYPNRRERREEGRFPVLWRLPVVLLVSSAGCEGSANGEGRPGRRRPGGEACSETLELSLP